MAEFKSEIFENQKKKNESDSASEVQFFKFRYKNMSLLYKFQ